MIKDLIKNSDLLDLALTHRSLINERKLKKYMSNERLEFLGDAVLELITTEFLYEKFPQENEGKMTALRSALVKTTSLAQASQEIGLDKLVNMSKGEEMTGGRSNNGILANTFEAFLGALFLDQGIKSCQNFLENYLFPKLEEINDQKLYKDSKSELQEIVQAKGIESPIYEVVSEKGPDHNKEFTIQVVIDGKISGHGIGKSKQQAQQNAASNALLTFLSKC
jgi:ribonuclease-3